MRLAATARSSAPLVLALALAGDLAACGADPAPAYRQPTAATCPPTHTLDYATFGRPFATAYCTLCHSSTVTGGDRRDAPPGLDFDSVAGLRAAADRIDRVAAIGPSASNRDMPPGNPRPTDDERRQLAEWLACGAP